MQNCHIRWRGSEKHNCFIEGENRKMSMAWYFIFELCAGDTFCKARKIFSSWAVIGISRQVIIIR